jgi:peptidoglycan/xylan/chitin deacetylase (PgdA/CDA1 family)
MMLKAHGRYAYAPITDRPDFTWPGGRRLALYIAIGVEEYSFGEGLSEDLLPGTPRDDLAAASWRDYGNRVGGFRVIEMLSNRGIRPTMLLNTALYDHAHPLVQAARAAGAEFVAHGIANSDTLVGLSPEEEGAYLRRVADRIAREEGAPPAGWSSPWLAQTGATIDLLAKQGFKYVLDLRHDDQPTWLITREGRLLSIPYALELNDSTTIIGRQASAREFADMIIDEFDSMLAASERIPLVMSLVLHSFISGQPFRLSPLKRALDHILLHRDKIWLTRAADIAAVIENAPDLAV